MLRLEKIFQKDDSLFIDISIILRSFFVFLSIYIFSILEFYSIYDLLNFSIYVTSNYFYFSLILPLTQLSKKKLKMMINGIKK